MAEGALLTQYFGTGHVSLDTDDCIPGLMSTASLQGNYNNVEQTGIARQHQVIATGGCIYAKDVRTLPNQLEEAGLT
jgi:phosphatidylinositol-3-phosphatase